MEDKIEYLRATVRPILLIMATMFLFVFAFEDARADIVEVFKWMVVGGWSWYFGERAWLKLRGK